MQWGSERDDYYRYEYPTPIKPNKLFFVRKFEQAAIQPDT